MKSLEPMLLTSMKEGYSFPQFGKDLFAGIVVGIIALPLGIAFAIASGVSPEQGLITAVVGGFLISVFSGSRVQIGGPTGAFIVLVYEIVHQFGYNGLAIATLLAGGLLIVMGLARFGSVIQFIPYPVTVGFTAGIAVVIASSQIRDALGLKLASVPAEFILKWRAYAEAIGTTNLWAVGITIATILIVVIIPRILPKVPGSIVAIISTTAVVTLFKLPVETIRDRFGAIPNSLPTLQIPQIDWTVLPDLISPAVSIALLAAIESLLSAVVADGMTGKNHRPNAELVAQGIANIFSPLFGGIPATGAIARTAANVKNGGTSPIAGIIHSITLLVILLAVGNWAEMVPMPALAGILFVVAWNMSELHLVSRVLKSTTKSDSLVLLSTFALTVVVDLTIALQVGVVLAAFLFMRRMAEVVSVKALNLEDNESANVPSEEVEALANKPEGVEVFEINGPFFFGAAHKFTQAMTRIEAKPRVLILRMRNVIALDATGLRVLDALQTESGKSGPLLVLSGLHAQPLFLLQKSKFIAKLGEENMCGDLKTALARAGQILAEQDSQDKN